MVTPVHIAAHRADIPSIFVPLDTLVDADPPQNADAASTRRRRRSGNA